MKKVTAIDVQTAVLVLQYWGYFRIRKTSNKTNKPVYFTIYDMGPYELL